MSDHQSLCCWTAQNPVQAALSIVICFAWTVVGLQPLNIKINSRQDAGLKFFSWTVKVLNFSPMKIIGLWEILCQNAPCLLLLMQPSPMEVQTNPVVNKVTIIP